VTGSLPAVFSAQKGLNDPRYPCIKGVMAAKRKTIEVKSAESLGLKGKVSTELCKAKLKEVLMPPERPQGRKLEGDIDTQVKELVNLLRTESHVL